MNGGRITWPSTGTLTSSGQRNISSPASEATPAPRPTGAQRQDRRRSVDAGPFGEVIAGPAATTWSTSASRRRGS